MDELKKALEEALGELEALKTELEKVQGDAAKSAELQAKLDEATAKIGELEKQGAEARAAEDTTAREALEKRAADAEAAKVAAEAELSKTREELEKVKKEPVRGGPQGGATDGDTRMVGGIGVRPFEDLVKEADKAFDARSLKGLRDVQERATRFLAGSMAHDLGMDDDLSKEFVEGYDFAYGSLQQILLPDLVKIWGGYNTPLLARIGSERAVDITDRWEDIQVPAVAENKQVEGIMASALTGVAVYPVVRTNTCQIVSRLIEVTGSADRAARNGVYGRSMADMMAMQMRVQMPQLVAEIEYSALFTVEVTQTSAGDAAAAARAMDGYVGAVGTFTAGLITTAKGATLTSLAGVELTESAFRTWLRTIALACQSPNDLPTAVYCPLVVMDKMALWDSVPVRTQDAGSPGRAGFQVVQYEAPWGATIDLVWEPQNSYSATQANNWMMAICEPNAAMRNLAGTAGDGGFEVINLPKAGDRTQVQLLWEGCNKLQVFAGSGILYNWACTV